MNLFKDYVSSKKIRYYNFILIILIIDEDLEKLENRINNFTIQEKL